MVSIPKVIGVLSCGFLLVLGLYLKGTHIIKGELFRVEPSSYFVQQYDGDQGRVHIDATTGRIAKGEHIELNVNDEHHALSMRSA